MKSNADLHIRCIDHVIFLPIARRLARDVAKVSYFSSWEKAFPTVRDCIGDGFEDIQRVQSPWQDKDAVDLWFFADVGFSHLQKELLSQGKIVWGARDADSIETMRGKFLNILGGTDLPVPLHEVKVGLSALREYLRDKEDRWIKISKFRGDFETFHWRSWAEDENTLDGYAVKFGPFRDHITFYVFEPIDTDIEDGCDTWCIDGVYPKLIIHGTEFKDRAYLGTFQKFSELPEEVRRVNDAFAPVLKQYGYRSFFSTEVRITEDGESYFTDPTCRAGSPPSQVMCEMTANLGEIVWGGANGECVEPEPVAKFGVQAIVSLKGDVRHWRSLKINDDVDQWLKCGQCMKLDDCLVFPPCSDDPSADVGWLVGIGDTIDDAIEHLKENVEYLPEGACCDVTPLANILEQVQEAEAQDMPFGNGEIPKPETVLS